MSHTKRKPIAESAIKQVVRTPQYASQRHRPGKGKGAYRRSWREEPGSVLRLVMTQH